MNANEIVQSIAAVATAIGVLMAWWQIRTTKEQAVATFEDQLTTQYRDIAATLPVEALLGEELSAERQAAALPAFYRYIDLTNEQVFLRQTGRVRRSTWANWAAGIQGHLERPAFAAAWSDIQRRAQNNFTELRRLQRERFLNDPRKWREAV